MLKAFVCFIALISVNRGYSQNPEEYKNAEFLKSLNNNKSYSELKKNVTSLFAKTSTGQWGEFVKGVDEDILTKDKIVAFTFDACGGKKGSGCDKELIAYLERENIPATLFITGKWIDSQFSEFLELSKNPLFEIENHGLNHRPCSISAETAYGITGTHNIGEAFDEIEANARKIQAITNHRPLFYRPATAFIDEACAKMAQELGIVPVTYQILSGDAVPFTPESVIENNVLTAIKPGAIVIMHMNHPEWNTKEAMEKIVPELRKIGYTFVLLKDFKLTSVKKEHRSVKKN
jgi:peptidoglycan/xylan/chitin deacetylase (PgdA/CDA1 family)